MEQYSAAIVGMVKMVTSLALLRSPLLWYKKDGNEIVSIRGKAVVEGIKGALGLASNEDYERNWSPKQDHRNQRNATANLRKAHNYSAPSCPCAW